MKGPAFSPIPPEAARPLGDDEKHGGRVLWSPSYQNWRSSPTPDRWSPVPIAAGHLHTLLSSIPHATTAAKYLEKIDFRDRLLKLVVYLIRLAHFYRLPVKYGRPDIMDRLARIDSAIVDCRMLLNHFKYIQTADVLVKLIGDKAMNPVERVLLIVRTVLWTLEVVMSDMSYYATHIFPSWDKKRLTRLYKFGKSTALTVLFAVEIGKVATLLRGKKKKGLSAEERKEVKSRAICMLRCILDCVVYYTWIDAYKPDKGLTYFCGLASAITGLYQQVTQ